MLSAAIGGPVLALSLRETAARNRFVGLHFMERYHLSGPFIKEGLTHVFGKDRAMTVEEEINELIAPNIRKRLFAALSYPAASQEQMLPYVPEHLRYMDIKLRPRPMLGFKRFNNAAITIAGIDFLRQTQKDQFNLSRLRLEGQTAPAAWNAVLAA
jgi:hypothetical protein